MAARGGKQRTKALRKRLYRQPSQYWLSLSSKNCPKTKPSSRPQEESKLLCVTRSQKRRGASETTAMRTESESDSVPASVIHQTEGELNNLPLTTTAFVVEDGQHMDSYQQVNVSKPTPDINSSHGETESSAEKKRDNSIGECENDISESQGDRVGILPALSVGGNNKSSCTRQENTLRMVDETCTSLQQPQDKFKSPPASHSDEIYKSSELLGGDTPDASSGGVDEEEASLSLLVDLSDEEKEVLSEIISIPLSTSEVQHST